VIDEGRERVVAGDTGATVLQRLTALLNIDNNDNDANITLLHAKCARAISNLAAESDTNRYAIQSAGGLAAIITRLRVCIAVVLFYDSITLI
jgi:hypothetical protein